MHKNLNRTHFFKKNKASNIIFTCEHASPRIPRSLKKLGLTKRQLQNCKDLYDPGAKDLFDLFVKKYKTSCVYSNLSRLVIDKNRHLNAKNKNTNNYHSALIKKEILVEENGEEYFIQIPLNQGVDFCQEEKLYNSVCAPYQNEIKTIIKDLQNRHEKVFVISIHTMFPSYNGPLREEQIDLMGYETDGQFRKVLKAFDGFGDLKVGINKPWGFKDVDDGCFFEIIKMNNVHVMAIEIRNDLLRTKKNVKKIFNLVEGGIMEFAR